MLMMPKPWGDGNICAMCIVECVFFRKRDRKWDNWRNMNITCIYMWKVAMWKVAMWATTYSIYGTRRSTYTHAHTQRKPRGSKPIKLLISEPVTDGAALYTTLEMALESIPYCYTAPVPPSIHPLYHWSMYSRYAYTRMYQRMNFQFYMNTLSMFF